MDGGVADERGARPDAYRPNMSPLWLRSSSPPSARALKRPIY